MCVKKRREETQHQISQSKRVEPTPWAVHTLICTYTIYVHTFYTLVLCALGCAIFGMRFFFAA